MAIYSKYRNAEIKITKGQFSSRDLTNEDAKYMSVATNIVMDKELSPTKVEGITSIPSCITATVGVRTPSILSIHAFKGEDNKNYLIEIAGNRIYYSTDGSTWKIVKYKTENVDIEIASTKYYNFLTVDLTISGTQKKITYLIGQESPISITANGTANKYCTISRAIRIQIDTTGILIGKNVYYDDNGTRTAGDDDIECGEGAAEVGWPKQGKLIANIFDRIIIANYDQANNGWIVDEAQSGGTDWTNASAAANIGGGKQPEPYTALAVYGSSFLIWSLTSITRVDATAGALYTWRETLLTNTYGCIDNCVALHSDGFIYFMSKQGLCRTNGQIVEKVDQQIDDLTKQIPSSTDSESANIIQSNEDWNAGYTGSLYVYSGILTMQPITANVQWATGSLNNVVFVSTGTVCATVTTTDSITLYGQQDNYVGWDNYTLGKGCTASTTNGSYPTTNAVDGNMATEWRSNSTTDAEWIYADIGYAMGIGGITYKYYTTSTYRGTVKLQYSLDSTNWVDLKTESPTGGAIVASWTPGNNVAAVQMRYIRVWATTSSPASYFSVYEIQANKGFFTDGNWISNIIDYGTVPSNYGSLTSYVDTNPGTYGTDAYVDFSIATSSVTTTFPIYTKVGSATISLGTFTVPICTTITLCQYAKIKASLYRSSDGNHTRCPTVRDISLGGQWVSAIQDLGSTPYAYKNFLTSDSPSGQTIVYEINTSSTPTFSVATGWVTLASSNTSAIPLNRYIKYRTSLSTADNTAIPYVDSEILNYYSASAIQSCKIKSYRDRLYLFYSTDGTYNKYTIIGETRTNLEMDPSLILGRAMPLWTTADFIEGCSVCIYNDKLVVGGDGKCYQLETGYTNNGTAFTSTVRTAVFSNKDCQTIWRYLYLYYKAQESFTMRWRTKNATSAWSAWSSTKTLPASTLNTRSSKITLPGLVLSDQIQFEFNTSSTDSIFNMIGIDIYYNTKPIGRS